MSPRLGAYTGLRRVLPYPSRVLDKWENAGLRAGALFPTQPGRKDTLLCGVGYVTPRLLGRG